MDSAQFNSSSFHRQLQEFDIQLLEESDNTIVGLWPDLTLAYLNRGWYRFAVANGGEPSLSKNWPLGRSVMDAIPEPLKQFFLANFNKCLKENRPWEHRYECSSVERIRKYHMLTFPVGEAAGLLVIHSLRQETDNTYPSAPPCEQEYRNEHGFLIQCCHCRRFRRKGSSHTWDWVPDWIKVRQDRVSHGLCDPCLGFHYSSQRFSETDSAQPFHTL